MWVCTTLSVYYSECALLCVCAQLWVCSTVCVHYCECAVLWVCTTVCVHYCECALGWVKCRAQIRSMGHHTWPHITVLYFSCVWLTADARRPEWRTLQSWEEARLKKKKEGDQICRTSAQASAPLSCVCVWRTRRVFRMWGEKPRRGDTRTQPVTMTTLNNKQHNMAHILIIFPKNQSVEWYL